MPERPTIAVVDDEPAQRALLDQVLRANGYETILCANGNEALRAAPSCSMMLLDVRMPGISGLEVLERLAKEHVQLPVILLTAYVDVRDAVTAIKRGAIDYIEKPVDLDELLAVVEETLGHKAQHVDLTWTLPPGVVAESPAARALFELAARAARTDATILLLGESGTGKEVMAEFIHSSSARVGKPFVRVDCASLPKHLAESELMGHEKGAFTGADSLRRGTFEMADGGTVFLDEIGELPLDLQPKFLRLLETGVFRRIGGSQEVRVGVRVVAATNRDLAQSVADGAFRQDLYYRLNVFPITLLPLRERRDDILPLAARFLASHHKTLSPAAQRLLAGYAWPGNIRELRNTIERAAILSSGALVLPHDLPPHLEQAPIEPQTRSVLVGDMAEIERRAILEALEKTGGNKTHAATLLGISRRNLVYKLRAYGM